MISKVFILLLNFYIYFSTNTIKKKSFNISNSSLSKIFIHKYHTYALYYISLYLDCNKYKPLFFQNIQKAIIQNEILL